MNSELIQTNQQTDVPENQIVLAYRDDVIPM